eukprot:3533775-Amphidinium_carterae.1
MVHLLRPIYQFLQRQLLGNGVVLETRWQELPYCRQPWTLAIQFAKPLWLKQVWHTVQLTTKRGRRSQQIESWSCSRPCGRSKPEETDARILMVGLDNAKTMSTANPLILSNYRTDFRL